MSCCNCGQPKRLCRCPKGKGAPKAPQRAYLEKCSDCDPCRPCKSMVKICTFVVETLEEGQVFHNSFIYNQEDDAVYYINDEGTPTRFGASPMFIDGFDPTSRSIPRQMVFDFKNSKAYVFNPEGEYQEIGAAAQPAGDTVIYISGESSRIDWGEGTLGVAWWNSPQFYDANKNELTGEEVKALVKSGTPIAIDGLPLFDILADESESAVASVNKEARGREVVRRVSPLGGDATQYVVAGSITQSLSGQTESFEWGLFWAEGGAASDAISVYCSVRKVS